MRREKFWKTHLLLSLLCMILALGPLLLCNAAAWTGLSGAGISGTGMLFGFGSDWLSQHLPIAESIRQAMLESGRLLPLYIDLGGGVSAYDFAYYGLLRPDVLLGCMLPCVGMEYILGGYAVFELLLGGNLVYVWLKGNCGQNTAGRSVTAAVTAGAGGAADSAFSLAANSLAWLGAVIFAYFANRCFVFRSDNSVLHEFMQFALLRLASLTVENILLYLLLTLMAMPNAAAKISVSIITVILNYAACKYKIFSVKEENR